MRRSVPVAWALALVVGVPGVLGLLGGCGDDEPAPPASDREPAVVDITLEGDSVSPSGERVDVDLGQPVELVVTADAPGEIHVHTKPDEQTFEYAAGTTTLPLTVDKPGVVEVESHDLEQVIVLLVVE
jgi:hypothetical protein